jgi:putative FmdB family regulatory protein
MGKAIMPIFEYICRDCQHQFETIVTTSKTVNCPACQGRQLDKQHSVFAVSTKSASAPAVAGGCGTCGDPRGPGSCRVN